MMRATVEETQAATSRTRSVSRSPRLRALVVDMASVCGGRAAAALTPDG